MAFQRLGPRPPGFARGGRRHSSAVRRCGAPAGFTLVELVVVIAVLAIVATVGMSRFASPAPFAARAASDQLASALRAAHRVAVAQRSTVHVVIAASPATVRLCRDAACAQPIAPADGSSAWYTAPGDTRLSASATFTIDGFGRPSIGVPLDLRPLDASGTVQGPLVRVEPETGLVHLPPL
jgi:prepilin-type N-terminal cleavage/methylation domain-containing protein